MAISGTGTGPFTITGNETTLNIYNFVVAANAANATKNSDNTQFDFNCVLNVGDGTTVTTWNSAEEHVRIDNNSFVIAANATLTIGLANPARAGGYWRFNHGVQAFVVNGTLRVYAARFFLNNRGRANTGAVVYFEECLVSALDSIDNYGGNPNIQYVRCNIAGATGVAVKLGGTTSLTGSKVSGAAYAYQPLFVAGTTPIYSVVDHVGQGNTYDTVPNSGDAVLNIDGAYELTAGVLVPRTSLLSTAHAPNSIVRLRWKYNLNSASGGSGVNGANVRIRNVNNTTVFSGQTDASGNITQQILPRVELLGSTTNIPRFPYSVKSRRFNITSEEVVWQCDNHTSDKFVHIAKPFAPASEAAGLAITGVSVVPSGATGGTVTISQARTATEIWQYFCAWIAQLANFDSSDTWTFDGTTLNLGAWNLAGTGTATGNFTTTGTVTAPVNGSYTDSTGTVLPVSITGITAGSRLRVYNNTTATEVVNQIVAGTSYTATYINGTGYSTGNTLTITATWQSGTSAKLPFSTQVVVGSTGWSALVNQQNDTVYNGIGVDGSTVTEFTPDYPNIQVDISDPNGQTSIDRLYSWFVSVTTSADGIRNWFNGIVAEDAANFRVVTSILNLKLDNLSATGVEFTGGQRLYRDDNASPLVASTTGGGSISLYAGKVYTSVVSTASPVITGDISQVPAAVQSGMTAQGYTSARAGNMDRLDVAVSTRTQSGSTISANITQVNGIGIDGVGTAENPWGPV